MIDLDQVRRWGTTALALLLFALWQNAEHNARKAIQVAAVTVETTAQCVATYGQAATEIGEAVDGLTTALRAE